MKDKHVSIPMTILSLAIGVIVIFLIIWLVLQLLQAVRRAVHLPAAYVPLHPRRRSITPLSWQAASWAA